MTVESKFTIAGLTKGKRYHVFDVLSMIDSYKIILDDGTIDVRPTQAFKIVDENDPPVHDTGITKMKKCEFCEASCSDGTCHWEVAHMPGSKESSCKKAIERMMQVIQSDFGKKKKK